jgi:hypothetical protein
MLLIPKTMMIKVAFLSLTGILLRFGAVCCEGVEVPSPAKRTPVKLTDAQVGYSYIEFPEDTFYMESMAQNEAFRPGVAYVPVQRYVNGQEESHLYEITSSSAVAKHIAGPITAPNGSRDITIFGSALSSKGILHLCAYNRNSILSYDLNMLPDTVKTMTTTTEIHGISAPNDVGLDPNDETVLYVAGGTFRRKITYSFSSPVYGRVYKVELSKQNKISVHLDGLNALAGVEMLNGNLWVSELFDIVTMKASGKPTVAWEGSDNQGQVWLADNIDVFGDNDTLVCPAYTTVPAKTVRRVLNRNRVSSLFLYVAQIASAILGRERLRSALRDPEVSLAFSNTYIEPNVPPAPVRLIFLEASGTAFHFEIDLAETRMKNRARTIKSRKGKVLGERHFFNEQVTHASHLKSPNGTAGFVACVNFEQPRILLLNDTVFREAVELRM